MLYYRFSKASDITKINIENTLDLLSNEQKKYIASLSDKKRVQSICVRSLLYILLDEFFTSAIISSLYQTPSGKPMLDDTNLYVSFTHSEEYVGCALSDRPVGIDIECVRDIKPSVISRICSEEEIEYIKFHSSADFFTLWTLKEAYIKASNKQHLKMRELSFVSNNNFSVASDFFITDEIDGYKWSLIKL